MVHVNTPVHKRVCTIKKTKKQTTTLGREKADVRPKFKVIEHRTVVQNIF